MTRNGCKSPPQLTYHAYLFPPFSLDEMNHPLGAFFPRIDFPSCLRSSLHLQFLSTNADARLLTEYHQSWHYLLLSETRPVRLAGTKNPAGVSVSLERGKMQQIPRKHITTACTACRESKIRV